MDDLDDFVQLRKTRPVPKPSSHDSWWLSCATREELNKEAHRRFPSATTGESFTGYTLQQAQRAGTL